MGIIAWLRDHKDKGILYRTQEANTGGLSNPLPLV
jgi:hypothetical protein